MKNFEPVLSPCEKTLAECIISAQMASDASKNKDKAEAFWGDVSWADEPLKGGYRAKPFYIGRAINLILKNRTNRFAFSVGKKPDQHGMNSFVVAFKYKLFESKIVSFHLPERDGKALVGLLKNSIALESTPMYGTSRGNARKLAQACGWAERRQK